MRLVEPRNNLPTAKRTGFQVSGGTVRVSQCALGVVAEEVVERGQ